MGDHADEEKKSPLDDIIHHMTAEWGSYGLPHTPAPAPAAAPVPTTTSGAHVWPSWSGRPPPPPQPYYVMGGGEPNPPIFFQADQPPPGFDVDPNAAGHAVKPNEYFKQSVGSVAHPEGADVIGTVVDIGGGNYVNVVYSGGPGGTVHPQYLSLNPNATTPPSVMGAAVHDAPTLENILSYPNAAETGMQHQQQGSLTHNFALFRDLQPQQVQAMIQQQQIQQLHQQQLIHQQLQQLHQNQSPQHQPHPPQVQQHHLQMSECLPHPPLHHHHQNEPPSQQHQTLQISQKQQQQQHSQPMRAQHSDPIQESTDLPKTQSDPTEAAPPPFSQNQDQLIQNLVGNWTGPNQTGRYNPFGLSLGQGSEPVSESVKDVENKRSDKNVRRTRIVAEVRPMRPSYSAVLTTPSPIPSPQKPYQSVNILASNNNNANNTTSISNGTNRINTELSRQKSSAVTIGSKGKVPGLMNKSNGSVSASSKLRRQHSSGSDEQCSTPVKSSGTVLGRKSTGVSSSGGLEEVVPSGNLSTTTLSRRWVSLDDLENGDENSESSNIYEDLDNVGIHDKEPPPNRKKETASVRGVVRGSLKPIHYDEAFLNNHKVPVPVGIKGTSSLGTTSNKRPIHINNNLGTTHNTQWSGQPPQATATNSNGSGVNTSASANPTSSSNANSSHNPKGEKGSVKGGKSCRTCSDERKGVKNESKVSSSGTGGSSSSSGRSGRGTTSMADKAAVLQGKRNQRGTRRKDGVTATALVIRRYGKLGLLAVTWFLHLLSDVVGMSLRLSIHLCAVVWENWVLSTLSWLKGSVKHIPRSVPQRIKQSRIWRWLCRWLGLGDPDDNMGSSRKGGRGSEGRENSIPGGLSQNISMPATGEEAMKRLLACKGKDPYSILGVTPNCSDDDVKKYYKRQAFLVHPDKNSQPGAEEAFKILVHAFELIGEPEKRAEYDRCVAETQQVEQAWTELSDLLSQLHQKMEYAANTIRCTNCGKRHKRVAVPRKPFAARFCAQCKIKHSAKEGDIWAETMVMGFLWHYYACMEGAVYDITDWASCQTNNLRHLKPNSHTVQYRIVLGRQRQQHSRSPSEPDLENFLSSLYNQTGGLGKSAAGSGDGQGPGSAPPRQEHTRSRKKGKRSK